jgi:flagellar biosynthesis protein FliQ
VTAPDLMELGERMTRMLVIGLLAAAVMAGSAFLWIGIPVAGLWAAGELTDEVSTFLLAILLVVPTAMVAFGWLLYRVNALYEAVLDRPEGPPARSAWLVSSSDERGALRRARGRRTLLDVSMTASAIAALVLMAVWFFFLAEAPLAPLP